MSDFISRQDAIDVLEILADKMSDEGQTVMAQAVAVLKDLRSAEPERTAKIKVRYCVGYCECGQAVNTYSTYCHKCGARLEWNELRKSN